MDWLTGWLYRTEVTLVEQSSGAYDDYPTLTSVAYDAHMKSNFADCRFTESDGTTLIDYGIVEKTDSVSCVFVIKRDYTSGCSLTVYLYYGNAGASDASVDHGPWALAWYQANGFGQKPSNYTDSTCSNYPHSATEAIPAWADVIFGGCTANGAYRTYYGRVKINGVAVQWASTVVCTGIASDMLLKWLKYRCTTQQYDHGSFVAGASNTVTWGHFSGSNHGFWVSYYPTDPSVSYGSEEGEIAVDLFAKFDVGQDSVELPARFIVNQWQEDLLCGVNVRHVGTPADLLGKLVVRHVGTVELSSGFTVRHVGVPVNLPGEFIVKQWQEDLPGEFVVRHKTSVDLHASFDAQVSIDLLGKFIVRHSGPAPWLTGWDYQKMHRLKGSTAGAQTDYPVGIKVYYGPGIDGDEVVGGTTFGKVYCDSKCKTDFGDIRFTNSDARLLDYWIEEQVDSDYAIIWVEVDSIPSPSTVDIYIYYGNAGASTTSNGDDTFLIFNDCATIMGWSVQTITGSPDWGTAIMDGATTIYIEANAHNEKLRIQYDNIEYTARENRRALTRVKHTSWNQDGYFHWYTPLLIGSPSQYDSILYSSYSNANYTIYASVGGVSDTTDYDVGLPSGWYRYEKKTNAAGEVTGYRDATNLGTATVDGDYSGGKVMYYVNEYNPGLTKYYIDWFAIGKYVDPEPTHDIWGPEATTEGGVLFAKFDVGQDSVELPARFTVAQWQEDLLAFFEVQASEDLLAVFEVRRSTSVELLCAFDVGQNAVNLPAEFVIRRSSSLELAASFAGQVTEDLFGEFSVRHLSSMDLPAEFFVNQWQEDLPAEFVIRRSSSLELAASFESQATEDLFATFVVRRSATLDLAAAFIVKQWQEDLHCRFRVENIYDLRGTAGIAFYWQGADNPPESIVDFIVESPTGFWVAEFYDGPARLRYVFIPWTQFRETGLDGSRPDMSRVDGFIYVVHTDGRRRIDYIHAPIFGDLHAFFAVRHTAAPLNLKAGFTVRHSSRRRNPTPPPAFIDSSPNLKAGFKVAEGKGFNDLKCSFFAMVNYTSWTLAWTRDYGTGILLDGVYVDNSGNCYITDEDNKSVYFRSYAGVETSRSDYGYMVPRRESFPVVISEGGQRYVVGENELVFDQFDIWRDGAIVASINPATDLGADFDGWTAIDMSASGKYIAFVVEGLSGNYYVMLYEGS